MSIQIRFITKTFGNFIALDNVCIDIAIGELVALLGPSGSGKTTLLRIIAGLEAPDSGVITFHGEDATDRRVKDRQVGFVFQHYALFRHMSVYNNVAFGLKVLPPKVRPSKGAIKEKVMDLLRLVHLDSLGDRYPSQLSGGQRQRVALARALAVEPKVLLLDEPFGALDARVRKELRKWLRHLHDEINLTSVFVTHDQEEALEVADRVVVMNRGRIEQIGTPEEVYDRPASPFVYHFLGNVNLFHGRIHNGKVMVGEIELDASAIDEGCRVPVVAYVRPHDIEIERSRNGEPVLGAVVQYVSIVGSVVNVGLHRKDTRERIEVELTRERYQELGLSEAEEVFLKFRAHSVFVNDMAYDPAGKI